MSTYYTDDEEIIAEETKGLTGKALLDYFFPRDANGNPSEEMPVVVAVQLGVWIARHHGVTLVLSAGGAIVAIASNRYDLALPAMATCGFVGLAAQAAITRAYLTTKRAMGAKRANGLDIHYRQK